MELETLNVSEMIMLRHSVDSQLKERVKYYTDEQRVILIKQLISQKLKIPIYDIIGKSRKDEVVYARRVCIMLCVSYTKLSFEVIGKSFNRDHATVSVSLKAIHNDIDFKRKEGLLFIELEHSLNRYIDKMQREFKNSFSNK